MFERGQTLVLWQDGSGAMRVMHQCETLRRAMAWCRANADAVGDGLDFGDVGVATVVIVEVKAVTRPYLKLVVDFEDLDEPKPNSPEDAAEQASGEPAGGG